MKKQKQGKTTEGLERLDLHGDVREKILPLCRLTHGEIWEDREKGHRVGVLDATKNEDIDKIVSDEKAAMVVADPPYNVVLGGANTWNLFKIDKEAYGEFSRKWVSNAVRIMSDNAHFYIWLGTDYRDAFQPLPDFILLMREFEEVKPRNIITMRNQRGYGTQKNWMWVRQELLYYVKGSPEFHVEADYTEIPRLLKGYYKEVKGKITDNVERSRSKYLRAGNVWVDIQQVFYRMEENVPGCYAQKPLKAKERIIVSGTDEGDLVIDFFAHSGSALIAGERLDRKVYTFDIDPVFAEIAIRRLEQYRKTGKTGWQWRSPFPEIQNETRKRIKETKKRREGVYPLPGN